MAGVLTLKDRKQARVEEIRAGFARLQVELSEYGRVHGGRFLVYGPAATGRFHSESGIDVLVDFDGAQLSAAEGFVEDTCADLHLKAHTLPLGWCTQEFLERVHQSALVLP